MRWKDAKLVNVEIKKLSKIVIFILKIYFTVALLLFKRVTKICPVPEIRLEDMSSKAEAIVKFIN